MDPSRVGDLGDDRPLGGNALALALIDRSKEAARDGAHDALALADAALKAATTPTVRADVQLLRVRLGTWRGNVGEAASLARVEAEAVAAHDPQRAAALAVEGAIAALQSGDMLVANADARRACQIAAPWPELEDAARQALAVTELSMATHNGAAVLDGWAASHGPLADDSTGMLPFVGAMRLWQGDLAGARQLLTQVVGAEADYPPSVLPFTLGLQAELERRVGAWDAGVRSATEGLELAQAIGSYNVQALTLIQLARFDMPMGRDLLGAQRLDEATRLGRLGGIALIGHMAAAIRGEAALQRGDVDEAIGELRLACDLSHRAGLRHPGFYCETPDLIEALARAGLPAEARSALDQLEVDVLASGCPPALAGLSRARVALADDDDLDDVVASACQDHSELSVPFERARTLALLGHRRRRNGDRRAARVKLAEALALFRFLGAEAWVQRTEAELRAAGGRVDSNRPPTAADLTDQEFEVALLVADGATNRDVASTLFLSIKTIERHLTNSYRKLGLRSRTELAGWVRDGDRAVVDN